MNGLMQRIEPHKTYHTGWHFTLQIGTKVQMGKWFCHFQSFHRIRRSWFPSLGDGKPILKMLLLNQVDDILVDVDIHPTSSVELVANWWMTLVLNWVEAILMVAMDGQGIVIGW